ncbi:hypothetical protein Btru_010938 [Bulinus truncatus]|nr:hypothetical protein Btru_010938 [Bulinus truncatus]
MNFKNFKAALAKGKQEAPIMSFQQAAASLDEESKEHFLTIIENLERRNVKYQKRCDELEVANGQFQEKFDQLSTDKKEIVSFWKKQVEQKSDEIADLNDRYIGLQQARDNEREAFKKQIQEQRSEYQEMKDSLTTENMMLGGKLASLEEFKVQKEELMAKFAMMEAELARKEKENQDNLYNLEKKAVIDKDRLKKEMILRVNQVAAEFRKVSNKQMAETTKRTIRENVSITAQLAKMSDKTIEMIQENDELQEKVKKLKQQVDMLEFNERELGKKNQSNLKIIKLMTEKCQSQEALIAEFEKREHEFLEVASEVDTLTDQNESMKNDLELLSKANAEYLETIDNLKSELKKEVHLTSKIQQVLQEAADAIKDVLTEKPDQNEEQSFPKSIAVTQTDATGGMSEECIQLKDNVETDIMYSRDHMLEKLLVLLDSAANLGVGPKPEELGRRPTEASSFATVSNIPGAKKGIHKGDFPALKGTLPHYSLGDLGLVPRPSQQIPTSLEKTKESAKLTKLGALHGVLAKSVATQTVNSPNSVVYASQIITKFPEHEILRDIRSSHRALGLTTSAIPKKIITNFGV